jgi:predicted transposase YdaD
MSHTFDTPLKELTEQYPTDWVAYLGLAHGARVDVIGTDLAATSYQLDKVIRVLAGQPWLLHLEFQTSRDPWLPRRSLRYNVLLHDRHALPVLTVLILLRPEADFPDFTGTYEYQGAGQRGRTSFHYEVIRVWQQPVEQFLEGGLGTLPLAPVSAVRRKDLPQVIQRMDERLRRVEHEYQRGQLWFSTQLLLGLKYEADFISHLLQGVQGMEESTVYQSLKAKFLAEGRLAGQEQGMVMEARKNLLRLGTILLGEPTARIKRRIEALAELAVLEELIERCTKVRTWSELFNTR